MKKTTVRRGRPRGFDREDALRRAMHVFWALGYEGTTMLDLQKAMGDITATSLYAAFGSKEKLFWEAVSLHHATVGGSVLRALTEPATARASVEMMLRATVESFSQPDCPRGCMIVLGAVNCTRPNEKVQNQLRDMRLMGQKTIRQRLERGVKEGDLPPHADLAVLVSFIVTISYGLSIQARDGASRKMMLAAVDCAMAGWDGIVGRS